MNHNLVRCLPIFAVAFNLSACSKHEEEKPVSVSHLPAVSSLSIPASFETSCGAQTTTALSSFNLSSCQLSKQQTAFLRDVGPFKVEADCAQQYVRISKKDALDQIVGEGVLGADGAFSVPLSIGPKFSEVAGCPVSLEGVATGTVFCDAQQRVAKIDVNTAFNLASAAVQAAEPAAEALELNAAAAPVDPNVQPVQASQVQPSQTQTDQAQASAAQAETPPQVPIISKGEHPAKQPRGQQDNKKIIAKKGDQLHPNKEIPKKGQQQQNGKIVQTPMQAPMQAPTQRMDACAGFSPCAFTSQATLGCGNQ